MFYTEYVLFLVVIIQEKIQMEILAECRRLRRDAKERELADDTDSSSESNPPPSDPEEPQDKQVTPESSCSGSPQHAPTTPQHPIEKRVAKNGTAYTKDQFMSFYQPLEYAEKEWEAAWPLDAEELRSEMTQAEKIVEDMYEWYDSRVNDQKLSTVFKHLQNTLFKNVTFQLEEDVWRHADVDGASEAEVQGEARMVVSREHVARQVQKVITWREKWLKQQKLFSCMSLISLFSYVVHSGVSFDALFHNDSISKET